jgi:hypothetical protein
MAAGREERWSVTSRELDFSGCKTIDEAEERARTWIEAMLAKSSDTFPEDMREAVRQSNLEIVEGALAQIRRFLVTLTTVH